jgi:hypothetical protein
MWVSCLSRPQHSSPPVQQETSCALASLPQRCEVVSASTTAFVPDPVTAV